MLFKLLFAAVLLYAAAVDIRSLTVPPHVQVMLLVVGVFDLRPDSLKGLLCAFIPLFLTALLMPGLGGGDVKFGSLCGFVMGPSVLFALLIGLMACLLTVPLYCKAAHKPIRETGFPLVPFLSFGCLLILFL